MDLRKLLGLHVPPKLAQMQKLPPMAHSGQQAPLSVQPQHFAANLGVPAGQQPQGYSPAQQPQPGAFNPGFTPLQNSGFGAQGNPQIRAFNTPVANNFNPQNNRRQQYWQ